MRSDETERQPSPPTTHYSRGASTLRDDDGPEGDPEAGLPEIDPTREDSRAKAWLADLIEAMDLVDPDSGIETSSQATTTSREIDGVASKRRRGQFPIGTLLFGRFELKEELGGGGFGIVFHAHDRKLKGDVALKVPHPDRTLSRLDARSFFKDAYAPARLNHPNIVKVHDVGDLGPLGCYVVSEFCDGPNLRDWMKERGVPIPPRLAAGLMERLADAVQHAHDNGILHRDVKPDNVLVGSRQGRAGGANGDEATAPGRAKNPPLDADIYPLLVDFGLARISDDGGEESKSGHRLGTLAYSPPEMVAGRRTQIGPGSDVYGLGATLYELLVGRPPFKGDDEAETTRLIMVADPVSPRSLRPAIPRDLETICLKCLNKDPADRFETAEELRKELGRFLAERPIETRPIPAWERGWKLARRRPLAAGMVGVAILGLLALIGELAWRNSMIRRHGEELEREVQRANLMAREADAHRRVAEEKNRLVARHLHAANLRESRRALDAGKIEASQEILLDSGLDPDRTESRDFVWRFLWRQANRQIIRLRGIRSPVSTLSQSPDRGLLASLDEAGTVLIWDAEEARRGGGPKLSLACDPSQVGRHHDLWFSNDSRSMILIAWDPSNAKQPTVSKIRMRIADSTTGWIVDRELASGFDRGSPTAAYDRKLQRVVAIHDEGGSRCSVRLIDLRNGWEVLARHEVADSRLPPILAPDGRSFAMVKGGQLTIRDTNTCAVKVILQGGRISKEDGLSPFVVFSEDGRFLAMADRIRKQLEVWESATGRRVLEHSFQEPANHIQLSRTGKFVACLDRAGRVGIVDCVKGPVGNFLTGACDPESTSHRLAFSPDERTLAVRIHEPGQVTARPTIRDVETYDPLATYPGLPFSGDIYFSADGKSLYVCGDRHPAIWRFGEPTDVDRLSTGPEEVWTISISPDGKTFAVGTNDDKPDSRTIQLRNRATGQLIAGWSGHTATIGALAFSPDGTSLASGSFEKDGPNLLVWDVATHAAKTTLKGHTDKVRSVAYSPDGRSLLTASDDRTVRIWDLGGGNSSAVLGGHTDKVRRAVYSPDGKSVASASLDKTVRIWDVATRETTRTLTARQSLQTVAWSPDGAVLATADESGDIVLWNPTAGAIVRTMHTELEELRCLAFSPDGKNLAAAGVGKVVRVWDVLSGQEVLSLEGHQAQINTLAFAPDGNLLISADHAGEVRLWRADAP